MYKHLKLEFLLIAILLLFFITRTVGVFADMSNSDALRWHNRTQNFYQAVKTGDLILANQADKKDRRTILEERLLSVAFRVNPKLILKKEVSKLFTTPFSKRIVSELKNFFALDKEFDPSLFAAKLPRELLEGFTSLILKEIDGLDDKLENNKYALNNNALYKKEMGILVKELELSDIKVKLENLGIKIKELEKNKDTDNLIKTEKEFREMSKKLSELEETDFKGIIL